MTKKIKEKNKKYYYFRFCFKHKTEKRMYVGIGLTAEDARNEAKRMLEKAGRTLDGNWEEISNEAFASRLPKKLEK